MHIHCIQFKICSCINTFHRFPEPLPLPGSRFPACTMFNYSHNDVLRHSYFFSHKHGLDGVQCVVCTVHEIAKKSCTIPGPLFLFRKNSDFDSGAYLCIPFSEKLDFRFRVNKYPLAIVNLQVARADFRFWERSLY